MENRNLQKQHVCIIQTSADKYSKRLNMQLLNSIH